MNLKYFKQRASHSQTPIKRSQNSIHLAQFFSRPSHEISNKKYHNVDNIYQQNIDPNMSIKKKNKNAKQNPNQITPKRKVIHLKSVSRNSKAKRDGNSGSQSRTYNIEYNFTEVTDFNENNINNNNNNNKQGIIIEVDLKKHRRSIQDTLTSSAQNQFLIRNQFVTCAHHFQKKATFMVKGKPYCDKCAAKLITKGFTAAKIDSDTLNQTQQLLQQKYQQQRNVTQLRNSQLNKFIQSLDKIDPILQSIGTKLQSYSDWLKEYCECEINKMQQCWNKMELFLQNYKQQLFMHFRTHQDLAKQMIQSFQMKIKQQNQNLKFMRNDIIRNVDKIIDQNTIPDFKFVQVMNNFKAKLEDISQNALEIQRNHLDVPKIDFDLSKLEVELNKFIFVRPFSQQLFHTNSCRTPSERSNYQYDKQDPYRMSFGKEVQKIASPTFKIL